MWREHDTRAWTTELITLNSADLISCTDPQFSVVVVFCINSFLTRPNCSIPPPILLTVERIIINILDILFRPHVKNVKHVGRQQLEPPWWSPYLFLALGHFYENKKRTKTLKTNRLMRATLLKEGNCACALRRCTCGKKKKHITQTFFGISKVTWSLISVFHFHPIHHVCFFPSFCANAKTLRHIWL